MLVFAVGFEPRSTECHETDQLKITGFIKQNKKVAEKKNVYKLWLKHEEA